MKRSWESEDSWSAETRAMRVAMILVAVLFLGAVVHEIGAAARLGHRVTDAIGEAR